MRIDEVIAEEYVGMGSPRHSPTLRLPIFKSPLKSEDVTELVKDFDGKVRFIDHDNNFYIFPASLLHSDAISQLKLPLNSSPTFQQAFLGFGRIDGNRKIRLEGSNQFKESIEPKMILQFLSKFYPNSHKLLTR